MYLLINFARNFFLFTWAPSSKISFRPPCVKYVHQNLFHLFTYLEFPLIVL